MKIIGYQGIEGSNSEEAAQLLANQNGLDDYLLMPLVSSLNVLTCVANEKASYGVIAIKNNHGGMVKESVSALRNSLLERMDIISIPIHHYLYVKDETITFEDIKYIASHPQAFLQCKETLKINFPDAKLVSDEDTATAARKLGSGIFSKHTAVLCRKNAGRMNDLHLLVSNLEDNQDNETFFELYKKTDTE